MTDWPGNDRLSIQTIRRLSLLGLAVVVFVAGVAVGRWA